MLIFYLFIAFCVPYCHDDWDWGLDVGLDRWLNATLNSRYVGSFFVIMMTRSEIIKTLVIAITMFMIPHLLVRVSDSERNLRSYLLANILILFIPKLMWQQTYGWVSAFANYVVAVPVVLVLIIAFEPVYKRHKWLAVLCLPLTVAVGLFHENLAVYAAIAAVGFTGYRWFATRRINGLHIAMTTGVLAGCIIMFSSSIYGSLLNNGVALDGIRTLSVDLSDGIFGAVRQISRRFFVDILPRLYFDYPIGGLFVTLSLTVSLLFARRSLWRILVSVAAVAVSLMPVYAGGGEIYCAVAAVCMILLHVLLIVILGGGMMKKRLFFLISAPLLLLPLAITPELGPRLYYLPYIFLLALGMSALPILPKKSGKTVTAILAVVLCLLVAFYGSIYFEIRSVTVARADALATAIETGADTVIMKKDPHKYWWGRNCGVERMAYFKEFYGIPEDITVIFEE